MRTKRTRRGFADTSKHQRRCCALVSRSKATALASLATYIEHLESVPLRCRPVPSKRSRRLEDPGVGGLRFKSMKPIRPGTTLNVTVRVYGKQYTFRGLVSWMCELDQGYEIGLSFSSKRETFEVRMVEQACRIESYRRDVLEHEGRNISLDRAAKEWIRKYSAQFAHAYP